MTGLGRVVRGRNVVGIDRRWKMDIDPLVCTDLASVVNTCQSMKSITWEQAADVRGQLTREHAGN
jgi:hypothetical protein